jgi:hypothetical protein
MSQAKSARTAVSIFGLSSEGYEIGAKLAAKGYQVYVVDEKLGTAIILRPDVAADYKDLRSFLQDEPLVGMKPSRDCLSNSKVVFFAPKLRRSDEDILSEVKPRLADVSKNISQGALFMFCVPLGIGGSREMIERIEHGSGLSSGRDFSFVYSPVEDYRPAVLGCDIQLEDTSVIEAAGFGIESVSLTKAELVHAQRVISKYSTLASSFETARRLTQSGQESPRAYKQIYLDDLSSTLFDLKVVVESLQSGDPLLYLGSGSVKSVDSYSRFLVERVRDLVKKKELKASRLKIVLFTDTDASEIRGDRLSMAAVLLEKLRDFYSDIEYLNVMKEGFTPPMSPDKTNLMIFLSGGAEHKLIELYEDQISVTKPHMMRANLPVEFVG